MTPRVNGHRNLPSCMECAARGEKDHPAVFTGCRACCFSKLNAALIQASSCKLPKGGFEPNHPFVRSPTMPLREERMHRAFGPVVAHRNNPAVQHRGPKPYRSRAREPTTQPVLVRRELERTTKTAPTNLPAQIIWIDHDCRSSNSHLVRARDNTDKGEISHAGIARQRLYHESVPVGGGASWREGRIFLRKYASQNSFINDASRRVTLLCTSSPLSKALKSPW